MTLKSHFPLQWQTGLGLVPITISLPYAWLYKHGDSLAQVFKANLLSHLHFIALFNNKEVHITSYKHGRASLQLRVLLGYLYTLSLPR